MLIKCDSGSHSIMCSIMSPLFLTEKCYYFKVLLKFLREQYFFHFVFSIFSQEKSYCNTVLQSFFHTHTHTHTQKHAHMLLLPILQKLNAYFKGQFKTYFSAPFHPFLELPFLIPEKAMAPHSSTLAWKIPWTEEPGGLQFMGSLRVGHD